MRLLIGLIVVFLSSGIASAQLDDYSGFPKNVGASVQADIVVTGLDDPLIKDIIVVPNNREIYVFRPDGTLRWKQVAGEIRSDYGRTPAVSDINGDNKQEIIMYGNPGIHFAHVYIWDSNGTLLKDINIGQNMIISPPVVADIGEKIILVGVSPGNPPPSSGATGLYAYSSSGNYLWYNDTGAVVRTASIAVKDIDGDNKDEAAAVVSYNGAPRLVILDLENSGASVLWTKDIGTPISGVAIDDIDNDAEDDIIIGSGSGVFAWDRNGSLIWSNSVPVVTHSPPAVVDINGDGIKDVIIGSDQQKKLFAISQGNMMPGFPVSTKQSVWSKPASGDINGDGLPEIVAGDFGGYIYGWDHTGKVLKGFPFMPATDSFMSSPMISDLEGTGKFQILAGNDNSNVYVWQTIGPIPPVAIISSPQNGSVFQLNSSINFTSSSTDEDGTIVSYRWGSDIDGLLGESDSITGELSTGSHLITLTVTDNSGLNDSSTINVRVNKPPVATIELPEDGTEYKQRDVMTFSGTGSDEDGHIVSYNWISDKDGIIGDTSSFDTLNLSTGIHNITLTVTDNDGAFDSTMVTINQTGYNVEWLLSEKSVVGNSIYSTAENNSKYIYKLGSTVPIKFRVYENGEFVVDKSVKVFVYDPDGIEIFSAVYGNNSTDVRINETKQLYVTNFKPDINLSQGNYKVEARFDSQRMNQEFSELIYLLDQDTTNFVNSDVIIDSDTVGTTYEWKLGNEVLGTGEVLSFIPDTPGVYGIQLYVDGLKVKHYKIIVNSEGDTNSDGIIDELDLSLLGHNWNNNKNKIGFDESLDVNRDGVIDILDAVNVGKKWS